MKHVCVFAGSSRGAHPAYVEAARQLARTLAQRGIGIVFGGGAVGLMGELADTALGEGGEVIGVIPRGLALGRRELAHTGLTRMHVVESMHERKALMASLSDAFIALPGGLGTFEETLEILTWSQLGIHRKPIGALNVESYFDSLKHMLEHAVAQGFVRPEFLGLLRFADTVDALLEAFAHWRAPDVARAWLDITQT